MNTILKFIAIPVMFTITLIGLFFCIREWIKPDKPKETFDVKMKRYAATRALVRYPDETPEVFRARYEAATKLNKEQYDG